MVQSSDNVDDEKKIEYCVCQYKRTGLRLINISSRKCKIMEYCYKVLLKATVTYNRKLETKDS